MPTSPPRSLRSALLLLGTVLAAAGLNLSVMNISTDEPAAAGATTPGEPVQRGADPEVVQVVVDVPVPTAAPTAASTESANPNAGPAARPTAVAPAAGAPAAAPVAPTPVAPTSPTATPPTTPADDNPPPPTAPSATTPPPTPPPTPTTTPPTPTTTPPTPTTAPQTTTEYLTYSFEGVAEIVVAYHDGQRLQFWSVNPEPGWAYQVEKDTHNKVEVKFRRTDEEEGEAKFELIREDGELIVKKER